MNNEHNEISPNLNQFSYFKNAYNLDVEDRAKFFKTILSDIHGLGFFHPSLGGPLSIEPFHPFTKEQVPIILSRLGYSNNQITELKSKGFGLISIPLISIYYPEYGDLLRECFFCEDTEYLFDPYYGVRFRKIGDHIDNKCIENSRFIENLKHLPKHEIVKLWKNKVNSLNVGVQAGKKTFRNNLGTKFLEDCKKDRVGELIVNTEEDFLNLVKLLKKCVRKKKNTELWLRGQPLDYIMYDRKELSRQGIVPYGNYTDSKLVPSIYRDIDERYDDNIKFSFLINSYFQWVQCVYRFLGPNLVVRDINTQNKKNSTLINRHDPSIVIESPDKKTIKVIDWPLGLSTLKKGLLLQHYGAPTSWLDITKDPQVALWMATNRFNKKISKYQPYSWSGESQSDWPTIFVFVLHSNRDPFLDSSLILEGTNILRPQRQKCGLLGGASNLARNHAARYISLKIRISPDLKINNPISQKYYFPDSNEDPFLRELLNVNSKILKNELEVFNPK